MKVIFCLRNFLPNNIGGTEIYVNALGNCLHRFGVETIVVKPGFGKIKIEESYYNEQKIIEYPESQFYDKELIVGNKKTHGLSNFRQVLINEKPDIVHFHEISGSNGITYAHMEIVHELGIPMFMTFHLIGYVCKTGTLLYKNKFPCDGIINLTKCSVCCLYNRGVGVPVSHFAANLGMMMEKYQLERLPLPKKISGLFSYPNYIAAHKKLLDDIFEKCEKVFVLSEWFYKILLSNSLPNDKMVLMKKAVPVLKNLTESKILNTNQGIVRFVYLGRICQIKGLHLLLKALNQCKYSNWTLDIFGQANDKTYLRKCEKVAEKNNNRVTFHDSVPPKDVPEILSNYDALVCPTIIEEMVGLVVMEAFAAKIPVIGSDSKGIAEQIVHNKNGLLFKSGSVHALGNILNEVLVNPEVLLKFKKNIQQPLDFEIAAKQIYETYSTLLNLKYAK